MSINLRDSEQLSFLAKKNTSLKAFLSFEYKEDSHTFSKGVLISYWDLFKNKFSFSEDYIAVRARKNRVLMLDKDVEYKSVDIIATSTKDTEIYSEVKLPGLKNQQIKEVEYNLLTIFLDIRKQLNRGINLDKREEVSIVDFSDVKDREEILNTLFNRWKQTKLEDEKVYKIMFNPNRYLRTYFLSNLGLNIYEKLILVEGEPYALINYYLVGEKAFELSFISDFKNTTLKFINDLNECILIWTFWDLYKNYEVIRINTGVDPGIKGLRTFKTKLPYEYKYIYRNVFTKQ